jgi:hypothetical protein
MFTPDDLTRLNHAREEINAVLDGHHLDLDLQTISFLCAAIQQIDMANQYVAYKAGNPS